MVRIGGQTDSSLRNACNAAEQNLNALQQTAGKVKKAVAVGAAAVGAGVVVSVKAAMDYEKQLSNISTLLTGTEAEVAARTSEIGDQILDISNRTGIAANDLTDGMYQVVSAFGDSEDAASILETAAKSAAAGNATTTESVNLLSAVTKGYGDTSAEAVQKASDLAFATVRLGQTSYPELAASMGKVIPLASTLGIEQEELFGAMATLTGVTGSTAEVVTQLKAAAQGFLSPSKSMTDALNSLGYESGQALLESEGLQGALEKLKGAVGGDELEFAKLFSSVEAQTAVLALAGNQAESFTSKTQAMYEAAGAADAAFAKQTDNLAWQLKKAHEQVINFAIALGTKMLPHITELAAIALPKIIQLLEKIGPVAEQIFEFVAEHIDLILALGAGITACVVAYKTAKFAITAYNAVMATYRVVTAAGATVTSVMAGAMGALNLPLLAAVAAIGLLVAAGVLLYKNWDQVKAKAAELWAAFQERFPGIAAFVEKCWQNITAAFNNGKAVLSNIIDFVRNVFTGNWQAAWQNVVNIFGNLFGGLVNLAKVPINAVVSAINFVLTKINGVSLDIPDWIPGVGGKTLGFNLPTIPLLAAGGIAASPTLAMVGEGGEPEAIMPLSKLADMLEDWTQRPTFAGVGGNAFGDNITFAPVFNISGNADAQSIKSAAQMAFAEFKAMYQRLKAEERRKSFRQ